MGAGQRTTGRYVGPRPDLAGRTAVLLPSHRRGELLAQFEVPEGATDPRCCTECFTWRSHPREHFADVTLREEFVCASCGGTFWKIDPDGATDPPPGLAVVCGECWRAARGPDERSDE